MFRTRRVLFEFHTAKSREFSEGRAAYSVSTVAKPLDIAVCVGSPDLWIIAGPIDIVTAQRRVLSTRHTSKR